MAQTVMLWQRMAKTCYVLEPETTPDGVGGFTTTWNKREQVQAAIVNAGTTENTNSGKAEEAATYTITSEVALPYRTVIQRESDGKTIRVTSTPHDSQTPDAATFAFYQVRGEEIRLEDE